VGKAVEFWNARNIGAVRIQRWVHSINIQVYWKRLSDTS